MQKGNYYKGFVLSFLSAFLYSLNVPVAKFFLDDLSSTALLFLLYLGSALGMFFIILFKKNERSFKPKKEEIPFISRVIICDVLAALLIVSSLKYLNASTVSLLSIFEIASTIMASYLIFKNKVNKNMIISLIAVTLGGIALSIDPHSKYYFSLAVLLVIGASFLWGLENNLTAKVSENNPLLLVFYKCFFVALFNLIFICFNNNILSIIINYWYLPIIGFFTYGISILCFAYSTKYIGASKTSIIFSLSPIFSTALSLFIFKENVNILFVIGLIFMIIGMYFTINDNEK